MSARNDNTMSTIITVQDVINVLEMLRGPTFVMISAGTMISGCGPLATRRPTASHARTATMPTTMYKGFNSASLRRIATVAIDEGNQHPVSTDQRYCEAEGNAT